MMRIVLFLATNIAVLVVLTVVMKLLGLEQSLGPDLNLTALLTMAAVMGMMGSFISLALSKWMAKRSVGAQVIEQPQTPTEAWSKEMKFKMVRSKKKLSNSALHSGS